MSLTRFRVPLALAALVPLMAASTRAPLDLQPESRLTIYGTSTVRAFQCQASSFDAKIESIGNAAVEAVLGGQKAVTNVVVTVPVEKLDCRNGTMNEHMRKALKANDHKTIQYRIATWELTPAGDDSAAVKTSGTLVMAGAEKPISVDLTAKRGAAGSWSLRGSKTIQMTEWGIKPPSLMFGTMKVRDPVTIRFELILH